MATTLDRETAAAEVVDPTQNDRIDVQWGWSQPTLPLRFVFREIDFHIDSSGHLQFAFRNSGLAERLDGRSIEAVAATYRSPAQPEPELMVASALEEPPQTPLDLGVTGDSIYVIYRLFGPRNITFSPSKKAVSHKNGADQGRYGLLRHLGPTGAGSIAPVADCELIYFACMPRAGTYRDRFNLNVELEQTPIPGNPPVRRIIELEIDPDIRFPGGSPTE